MRRTARNKTLYPLLWPAWLNPPVHSNLFSLLILFYILKSKIHHYSNIMDICCPLETVIEIHFLIWGKNLPYDKFWNPFCKEKYFFFYFKFFVNLPMFLIVILLLCTKTNTTIEKPCKSVQRLSSSNKPDLFYIHI